MIRRVYEQAKECNELSEVIVATDDPRIEKHVSEFGGKVMMTSEHHNSGTERCSEVCLNLRKAGQEFDMIVNIQGDEPYIHPEQITELLGCFNAAGVQIASLMKKIISREELNSPDVVKVVTDTYGRALYFSRATIPFVRGREKEEWLESHSFYKHIGIYGYRPDVLLRIVKLPVSAHEKAESLEQLRWLDNGFEVILKETVHESLAIDVPADLLKLTNRE